MTGDGKIIKGSFATDETKKNKIITDIHNPALLFTAQQWCDTFEMWQYIMWERKTNPQKYLNMPEEAMKPAMDIAKAIPLDARMLYDKAWKELRPDIIEFGLHDGDTPNTIEILDDNRGFDQGVNIHRESEGERLFIPAHIWLACGYIFYDWYGKHRDVLDPSRAVRKMLKERGIKNETDFLNSDLGKDRLIANPF